MIRVRGCLERMRVFLGVRLHHCSVFFIFSMKRGLKSSVACQPRNRFSTQETSTTFWFHAPPKTNITMEKNKNNHLKMYFLFNSDDSFPWRTASFNWRFYRKTLFQAWKKTAPKKNQARAVPLR